MRELKSARKRFIDEDGNAFDVDMTIEAVTTDQGFEKVWLGHLAVLLDLLGSSKIKVLGYLLEKRNYENRIIATQSKMAKELGVSRKTVADTLLALKEADALRMEQYGVYRLNPAIIFRGGHEGRVRLLFEYRTIGQGEGSGGWGESESGDEIESAAE